MRVLIRDLKERCLRHVAAREERRGVAALTLPLDRGAPSMAIAQSLASEP